MLNTNGKGDKRRPMRIDPRQLDFNWNQTFTKPADINNTCQPSYIEYITKNASIAEL